MAFQSTCVSCKNAFFELVEQSPSGSNYKLLFIRCSKCGGVAGVLEYFNNGTMIQGLQKTLNDQATAIGNLQRTMANMEATLARIERK